jgi:hypothetical protein
LKKNKTKSGQALIESVLLFFPLLLLSFYAFGNAHDEFMQEFKHTRLLRQVMLKRSIEGFEKENELDMDGAGEYVGKNVSYKLPGFKKRTSNHFKNEFTSSSQLNYDKILKGPQKIFNMAYRPATVTLTFNYQVNAPLAVKMFKKRKSVQGTILQSSELRKKGMQLSSVLGVAAAFYK